MQGTRVTIEPDTVLLGKLRVVSVIGRGAMGAVYEVEHLLTKHHRALKVLHRDLLGSGSAVSRFLREATVAGRLGSDRVVQTLDVGQLEDGSPYVLMELLRGRTLADLIESGTLSPSYAVHVAREIAAGMGYAHEHGIVHRDLKPANVFLAESDDGGEQVKILDFGISKFTLADEAMPSSLTVDGVVLGTPHYMSPEQAGAERDVDHRTDVYALGVILYEALTGRRPYHADTFPALVAQIHRGEFTPLDTLPTGIDPRLAAIVHRAIHPDRDKRVASMGELGAALEPFDRWTPDETLHDGGRVVARPADPPTLAADDLVPPRPPAPRRKAQPPAPPKPSRATGWWVALGVVLGAGSAAAAAWVIVTMRAPEEIVPSPPPPPLVDFATDAGVDAEAPAVDAAAPILDAGGSPAVDGPPDERRGYRRARQAGLRTDNPYGGP